MINDPLYPPLDPSDHGMMDVGDGHNVYWEVCGSPEGKPVIFLHGGPGGGCNGDHRRYFDPDAYRIVLMDQRGCGRSTPHAGLEANTTWHLVDDIERLRTLLGIDKWQVFGGSWGSCLALAYAETHPERVTELVLRGIFTLRRAELLWFYQEGASWIVPDYWEDFIAPIPEAERGDIMAAYHKRLTHPDREVQIAAAKAWSVWEGRTITMMPNDTYSKHFSEDDFALAFARIENHYFVNRGFMEDGQLIRDAGRLRDIPGIIVQGRYDIVTPFRTAWDLHRAWPASELQIVPDAGHTASEPGIAKALVAATDRFRN